MNLISKLTQFVFSMRRGTALTIGFLIILIAGSFGVGMAKAKPDSVKHAHGVRPSEDKVTKTVRYERPPLSSPEKLGDKHVKLQYLPEGFSLAEVGFEDGRYFGLYATGPGPDSGKISVVYGESKQPRSVVAEYTWIKEIQLTNGATASMLALNNSRDIHVFWSSAAPGGWRNYSVTGVNVDRDTLERVILGIKDR